MVDNHRATLHPEQIADLAARCGVKGSAAALAEFAALAREAEPMAPEDMRPAPVATGEEVAPDAEGVRSALQAIHDTFKRDLDQGYKTKDKEYAVAVAAQALAQQAAPEAPTGWQNVMQQRLYDLRKDVSTACQLLADNEWAGHFATTPEGRVLESAIAKLIPAPATGAAPEAPVSEQQAQADRVVEWSASYAATTASASGPPAPSRDAAPLIEYLMENFSIGREPAESHAATIIRLINPKE